VSKKKQRKNPHLGGLPTTGGSYVRTEAGAKYAPEAAKPTAQAPAEATDAAPGTDPNPKRVKR
jgi:hypothetical protein